MYVYTLCDKTRRRAAYPTRPHPTRAPFRSHENCLCFWNNSRGDDVTKVAVSKGAANEVKKKKISEKYNEIPRVHNVLSSFLSRVYIFRYDVFLAETE